MENLLQNKYDSKIIDTCLTVLIYTILEIICFPIFLIILISVFRFKRF